MKICVTITTRGNYGKQKSLIEEILKHNSDELYGGDLILYFIYGGEALLPQYWSAEKPYFSNRELFYFIDGENNLTMAQSAGLALMQFANAFHELQPDVVTVVGDRYDTLAITMAAAYQNIPVAHIEGGEVSGSIDESIRHAITKLSHIHFPATEEAAERIRKMGEEPDTIHVVGASSLDVIPTLDMNLDWFKNAQENQGVGGSINIKDDYIVVLYHPVTTEYNKAYQQTIELINAVIRTGYQAIWIWPHGDAGSDGVSKAIRETREQINHSYPIRWFKGFSIEQYLPLINGSICLVGNSSSGIRESAFLGVPVVNIGSRQCTRKRGKNVIDTECNEREISDAIFTQFEHGRYEKDNIYGDGNAGKKMLEVLKNTEFKIQKRITY